MIVYVRLLPTMSVVGEAVLERTRSTPGLIVLTTEALSFSGLVSSERPVKTAELVAIPVTLGLAVMVKVAVLLEDTSPNSHVTTPLDSVKLPCEDVAETNVISGGNGSVSTTLVAPAGPGLAMVSV